MRAIIIAGLLAVGLAGCQTAQESLADAEVTCEAQGFRPGTRAYNQCRSANYVENRRASNETASAVTAGVAAGVVGGAIAASASRPYYRRGYYYGGPGYWW
jgi:outer membrane lipoprotein SlyB